MSAFHETSESVVLRRWESASTSRTQRFSFPSITLDIKASLNETGTLVLEPRVLSPTHHHANSAQSQPAEESVEEDGPVKEARLLFSAAYAPTFYSSVFASSKWPAETVAHALASTLLALRGTAETQKTLAALDAMFDNTTMVNPNLIEESNLVTPLATQICRHVCCSLLTTRVCLPTLRSRHTATACIQQAVNYLALSWLALLVLSALLEVEGLDIFDQPIEGGNYRIQRSILRRPATRSELWCALQDLITEVTDAGVLSTIGTRGRLRVWRQRRWREPWADSVQLQALSLACCPWERQRQLRPKLVTEWLLFQSLCFPPASPEKDVIFRLVPITQLLEGWQTVFTDANFTCTEATAVRLMSRRVLEDLALPRSESTAGNPLTAKNGVQAAVKVLICLASSLPETADACELLGVSRRYLNPEDRPACVNAIREVVKVLTTIFSQTRTERSLSVTDASDPPSAMSRYYGASGPLSPIPSARSTFMRSHRVVGHAPVSAVAFDRLITAFLLLESANDNAEPLLAAGLQLFRFLGGNLRLLTSQSKIWKHLLPRTWKTSEMRDEIGWWPQQLSGAELDSFKDMFALQTPRRRPKQRPFMTTFELLICAMLCIAVSVSLILISAKAIRRTRSIREALTSYY